MNARVQEDSFPTARQRGYSDVIDFANHLCMEIRAKKLRAEYERKFRQTLRALPYQVHFGTCHCQTQHFTTFPHALAFLSEHVDDEFMPALVGAGFDDEHTGLTADERDLVAAVLDDRKPRRRVR